MTKKLEPSDYLGAEVIVTSGGGTEWSGTAIAYRDQPSLMIQRENGMRMMLPADNVRYAEPRPAWHDAKPGEVWVITTARVSERKAWTLQGGAFMFEDESWATADLVTAGRRIFPEASDA